MSSKTHAPHTTSPETPVSTHVVWHHATVTRARREAQNGHRHENIRRVAEVAKLFLEAGVIVLTAFISPIRSDRKRVRGMVGKDDFLEIYCNAPIEVCEERDAKGLYRKARAGLIPEFTGISAPYEAPKHPDIEIDTGAICRLVQHVVDALIRYGIVPSSKFGKDIGHQL